MDLDCFSRVPFKCLLRSYVPRKNKNVLLISTMHNDDATDAATGEAYKPEVITFYNLIKGGLDVVDRLKSEYSVSRISNRWPMTVFNGLLNVGATNAQIIYKPNTGHMVTRRNFIAELAKNLCKPHLLKRGSLTNLSIPLRQKIRNVQE